MTSIANRYHMNGRVGCRQNISPSPTLYTLNSYNHELKLSSIASGNVLPKELLNEYGGIVSLTLAGSRLILIGDIKVAKELLVRRAAKHSSCPFVPYIRRHLDPCRSNGFSTTKVRITALLES
ncbi:hypothetical protein E4T56_gene19089 [Termitomyces sp. T112]|nr:hypothetical protein E4T56_gene19089 [Termitomyces sp. T112]